MIQIFNKCLHGFIIIPIVDSFCKKNIFNLLAKSNYSFKNLATSTNANLGYFGVALNTFEALGWIKKTGNYYSLGEDLPSIMIVPECIQKFYQFPFESYIYRAAQDSFDVVLKNLDLTGYLKSINYTPLLENDRLSAFLDGAILMPLLFLMRNNLRYDSSDKSVLLDDINNIYIETLEQFFAIKKLGTIKSKKLELSPIGGYLMDSIQNAGVTLSYRPMLSNIDKLIFGNESDIGKKINNDWHVDRTLNVIGSGYQHQVFFKDFQILFKNFLSSLNVNDFPLAIVDMGCGDGSLLTKCYEVATKKENIILFGIDYSNSSLREANRNLKGLPYKVMHGDIVNPRKLIHDLTTEGFANKNKIIHIRSFLDHNRPYNSPKNKQELQKRTAISYSGKYVGYNGESIPSHHVVQNLVEHFQEWSSIIGPLGLITLEVFSLPTNIIKQYLEETESLHFDAYHGFSKQLLVEAHVYMMAAAEAGLFPLKKNFKKYPTLLPYTRISLQQFLKKTFIIRHPFLSDVDKLVALKPIEGSPISLSYQRIKNLIMMEPEEQYILENNHNIACAIFTHRTTNKDLYELNSKKIEESHALYGDTILIAALQVAPFAQELIYELLSFVLHNSFVKNGVNKVVTLVECGDFDIDLLNRYYSKKDNSENFVNPLTAIYHKEGAELESEAGDLIKYRIKHHSNVVPLSYNYLSWLHHN